MMNVKLLSTSIMIVFGVYGHKQCMGQSAIAAEVLKALGYNAKMVGGYHAMVHKTSDSDIVFLHAPLTKVPFSADTIHFDYSDKSEKTWFHCWVETGDKIIDINFDTIIHKKYTDISKWELSKLLKGKSYYMPTDYNVFSDDISIEKIYKVIEVYEQFKNVAQNLMVEEGPIHIRRDGSWYPLPGYKLGKTVLPHTKAFAENPNIIEDMMIALEEAH